MTRLPENDGDTDSNLSNDDSTKNAEGNRPSGPARREFLRTSLLGTAAIATAAATPLVAKAAGEPVANAVIYSGEVPAFELDEITITDLQDGMKSGKFTSRSITEKYLGAYRRDRQARPGD